MKKVTSFLHKNTHRTIPFKKSYFFLSTHFFIPQYHFCFYFTLEVEGVLFLLMASCFHKKFQILLCIDYDLALGQKKIKAERSKSFYSETSRF